MNWLAIQYRPTSLFALKTARATSTVGKTLLVPTPYAVKMAFLDVGLRTGIVEETAADALVAALRRTTVTIGVPREACVTGTIQKIRQEPKKRTAEHPYIQNVAFREVVFLSGDLTVALGANSVPDEIRTLAPYVNYFGKRGSFFQFVGMEERPALDETFTQPIDELTTAPSRCHLATLDDFGDEANFDALNSFSDSSMKRERHRKWRECVVPLGVCNFGAGFVHYRR